MMYDCRVGTSIWLMLKRSNNTSVAVAALGIGTVGGMSLAAGWLAVSLRRSAGPECLAGAGTALLAGAVGGVVAGAGLAAAAWRLPDLGVVASALVALAVAGVAVAIFLGVAAALDRPTVQLVLRRRAVADA